jgi:hypothetical protein
MKSCLDMRDAGRTWAATAWTGAGAVAKSRRTDAFPPLLTEFAA